MSVELEKGFTGVKCLHCGVHTPLPEVGGSGRSTTILSMSNPAICLVRCHRCGKEAPYLAGDMVVFKEMTSAIRFAA